MGCGSSKIKKINLTPDDEGVGGDDVRRAMTAKSAAALSNGSSGVGSSGGGGDESSMLPNRLLSAAIPVSDLGESLDSRMLGESLNIRYVSAC